MFCAGLFSICRSPCQIGLESSCSSQPVARPAAKHRGDNPQPHGPLAAMVLGRTVLVSTPYNTASGVTFQPNPVRSIAKISSHLTPGFALQNQGNHLRL